MLSIVIPCYNEAGNIPLILERVNILLDERNDIEILLVDNGSTDNSVQVFEKELVNRDRRIKVVRVTKNQGYGFGILCGLKEAKGKVLAWTHADMQTDPLDIIKAYDIFLKEDDENLVVKGKRINRRFIEAFFTWGMEILGSITLKTRLTDINAQPKLFSRYFFESISKDAPLDFSLDLYLLYWAKKKGRILEFPVFFAKRKFGEAKGGGNFKTRIKLIKRTSLYIFELKNTFNRINKR